MGQDLSKEVERLNNENKQLKKQVLVAERLRQQLATRVQQAHSTINVSLFAAGIAHEFNNILGSMHGHAEWALQSGTNEDLMESIEMVRLACERSSQITRALQGFAQLKESDKKIFHVAPFGEALEKFFAKKCAQENIKLSIQLEDVELYGSEHEIFEVLMNLIKNSIESIFTEQGKIIVQGAVDVDQKYFSIRVSDNGLGIDPVFQEAIFQPFFTSKGVMAHVQPQKQMKKVFGGGSGLGLYLSKMNAIQHGGDLLLERSELNHGSTFCLSLPVGH